MPVTIMPKEISRRGPSLFTIEPESGEKIIMTATIGTRANPVRMGEKPWMFCW